MKETLICEAGNHKWTRESTRGRKPRFCEKHKPAPVVPKKAPAPYVKKGPVTLHCENGDHDWKRPAQKGRAPKNCPKHQPVKLVPVKRGAVTLHCELGNHDWTRDPKKGRVPKNCPEHTPIPKLVIVPTQRNKNGKEELHCANGDHDWERYPQKGKKPVNCPVHKRKPRTVSHDLEETPESYEAKRLKDKAKDEKKREDARKQIDDLELALKARGTHLSQQTPYRLYKLKSGLVGSPSAEYEFIEEHSPLQREQFLNKNDYKFVAKVYRYEREGQPV